MLITRKSAFTGKTHTLDLPVTQEQMDNWLVNRPLIQRAFPNLSPEQREFILTGVTPEEWNVAFPPDEDEY